MPKQVHLLFQEREIQANDIGLTASQRNGLAQDSVTEVGGTRAAMPRGIMTFEPMFMSWS